MSSHLGRALMRNSQRQPFQFFARNASSTTETAAAGAQKAGAAAGQATSKASEGLSKVTSSAGPALNRVTGAASNALNALGKVGGRTGQVVSFVQCMPLSLPMSLMGIGHRTDCIFHSTHSSYCALRQSRTGARKIGSSRQEDEPSVSILHHTPFRNGTKTMPDNSSSDAATFSNYFQPLLNNLRNPSNLNPNTLINRIRNADNQQMVNAGIVTAEVIGFFTVGEMIGRMKIVGYRTSGHAHGGEHH